jgi:DNA-binding MarR family transcriptional regulator
VQYIFRDGTAAGFAGLNGVPAKRRREAVMARKKGGLKLSDHLCFAVYSAGHAFNRVYKPHLERLGLTYPQYLTMMVLWEEDGLPVKAIGARLGLDSGTLTPLLKRLEAAGLLVRSRDARDERSVRVALTDAGRALESEAESVPFAIGCAMGRSMPEIVALREQVAALRDALEAFADEQEKAA